MGGFVAVSLSIMALLEFLCHKSSSSGNDGGLVFAADVNNISLGSTFGYGLIFTDTDAVRADNIIKLSLLPHYIICLLQYDVEVSLSCFL
jgi:hypothetical protein